MLCKSSYEPDQHYGCFQERQERKVECEHRERLPDKYFFTDVGLRNARLNSRQIDSGRLMENIVYNELDSLKFAKDFFSKIIVQNDISETFCDTDGILHLNLVEFLLIPKML